MSSSSARVKTLPVGLFGRVDDDGAGARREGGAQLVGVERPVRRPCSVHEDERGAGSWIASGP